MFSNFKWSPFYVFKLRNGGPISSLQEWRIQVLDGILGGIFILWLAALVGGINNVLIEYRDSGSLIKNSDSIALLTITVYVVSTALLAFITFNRKLKFKLRAGILLLTLYVLGTIGMLLTSFSGDGRIFLFAFVILAGVFCDLRVSLTAFFITVLTLIVIGYLQISGTLTVPPEWQVNAALPGAWISGGIILIFLSIAILISISYLLQALDSSLVNVRQALQREQRLSQILRTVSEVNQLTTRVKDKQSLLQGACNLLKSDRGYAFAWIVLMGADKSLRLGAYAGDDVDESKFNFEFGDQLSSPACIETAIRTRKYVHVAPSEGEDACKACPRRVNHPNRTAIALPLLHHDQVLGALVVDYDDPSLVFDEQEISLLQELADNLAYALKNIEASKRLNVYASRQRFLNEVNQMALTAVDLDSMMEGFVSKLKAELNADDYYFILWDESKNGPSKYIGSESVQKALQEYPSLQPDDRSFSRSILDEGRVLAITDIKNTPYISPHLAEDFEARSAIGLPLIAADRRLGVLVYGYRESHIFTAEEMELAEQASYQFALAVLKVILNEETRLKAAELEQLYSSAKDMASSLLDSTTLLVKFARHMTEALKVTSTNITSFNHATNRMKVVAEYWSESAAPGEIQSDLGVEYTYEDYATVMHAMMQGKEIVVHANDKGITHAEHEQFLSYQIKSMMFVPIMSRGQLLGTVEIWESRKHRDFSQADIHLALAMASHAASVIESAKLYEKMERHDSFIRALFENSAEGVAVLSINGKFNYISPTEERILGYDVQTTKIQNYLDVVHPADASIARSAFQTCLRNPGELILAEYRAKHQDGSWRYLEVSMKNLTNDPNVGGVVANFRDITERKQTAMALEQREAHFRALIENSAEGVAILDNQGKLTYLAPAEKDLSGYDPEELVGTSVFDKMHPEDAERLRTIFVESLNIPSRAVSFEYRARHKNGEWQYFDATGNNLLHDPSVQGIVVNYRNITTRKQTEQALKESQDRLFSIITTAPNGIIVIDSFSRIVLMNPAAERIFVCSSLNMLGKDLSLLMPERYRTSHHRLVEAFGDHGVSNRRIGRYETLYGQRTTGEEFPMEAFISKYEMNGDKFYTVTLQDITERKQDEDNLRRRAEELQQLASVSSGLRIAMNVSEIIPLVVRHAVDIVSGHYGTIYLLEEGTGNLASPGWYSVDKGEDINATGEPLLRHAMGKGITGHVAKTGEIYITEDIHHDPIAYLLPDEKELLRYAHSGISLPLLSREKVIGVLHIRLTTAHTFSKTEIRLLTAIAEMAGNALHRATLYEQTLFQAEELARAYDSTLSGWARALELRDELTEGHTRRVTELTLELARAMNIPETELVQIRRGAILHDIGKMGIPDSILNKPGPLAAHEQRIMRMHPQYAYEMLSFIPFLQSALDIPFCHHEWWNGEGYPRGLKGEEIPLSARIFSVVDVWDALTSDRPYRAAWTPERTLNYLQDGSGKQFEPRVVEAFLSLIKSRQP